MTSPSNNRKPVLLALAASALLTVLIVAALFGYTVASVVAFGAIVFRYAIWLQRPATRVYWRRGWPFGMYTVCTFQLSNAINFPPLLVISRFFIYPGASRLGCRFSRVSEHIAASS